MSHNVGERMPAVTPRRDGNPVCRQAGITGLWPEKAQLKIVSF